MGIIGLPPYGPFSRNVRLLVFAALPQMLASVFVAFDLMTFIISTTRSDTACLALAGAAPVYVDVLVVELVARITMRFSRVNRR